MCPGRDSDYKWRYVKPDYDFDYDYEYPEDHSAGIESREVIYGKLAIWKASHSLSLLKTKVISKIFTKSSSDLAY